MRTVNNYRQTAMYWAAPISDGYGGNTFTAPKTLKVRWEEKQEQFTDPEGKINISRAVVWVPVDVTIGGYLLLGTSTEASPDNEHESYRIMQFVKTPNLRNIFNERRAFL